MGNSIDKKVTKLKNKFIPQDNHQPQANQIGIEFECPNCTRKFPPKTVQS